MMETNEKGTEKKFCRHGIWHCIGFGVLGVLGFAALLILGGFVIMWLWNWLAPNIFHLATITYWQAVGLAILARILFGGCGHGMHGRHHGKWHRWHHAKHGCCGGDTKCSCGNDPCECETSHGDHHHGHHGHGGFEKWRLYDEFWKEEGETAFNEYVKRK